MKNPPAPTPPSPDPAATLIGEWNLNGNANTGLPINELGNAPMPNTFPDIAWEGHWHILTADASIDITYDPTTRIATVTTHWVSGPPFNATFFSTTGFHTVPNIAPFDTGDLPITPLVGNVHGTLRVHNP